MGAETMLATPRPGTLGDLMARAAETLECQVEALTELVVRADDIINEIVENQADWVKANEWLDDAAPIVGEAT